MDITVEIRMVSAVVAVLFLGCIILRRKTCYVAEGFFEYVLMSVFVAAAAIAILPGVAVSVRTIYEKITNSPTQSDGKVVEISEHATEATRVLVRGDLVILHSKIYFVLDQRSPTQTPTISCIGCVMIWWLRPQDIESAEKIITKENPERSLMLWRFADQKE